MYIDYSRIPSHCQESMQEYVENGRPVGSFLFAVLSNNLLRSFEAADDINRIRMQDYAILLYNIPMDAWGSEEKVNNWIHNGGLNGLAKQQEKENENIVG